MASQVTALAWRPQTFDEIVGQDVIVQTLTNAIATNRIHHAYLFSGLRGSGKTSTARILAKALNCKQGPTATPCLDCVSCREIRDGISLDVVEIDAASNNSVDNIRELREWVRYNAVRDAYKIYIIDEVHMLSASAFNALLKTLEEPPERVVFILATTEVHKIPATILSRTQQFEFRRIVNFKIEEQVKQIAHSQGVRIDGDSVFLIAKAAGGSMRDALSIFDQVVSYTGSEITPLDVKSLLGVVADETLIDMLESIVEQSGEGIFNRISELVQGGHDLKQFYDAFTTFVRDSLVMKTVPDPTDLDIRTYGHGQIHADLLKRVSQADLIRILDVLVTHEPTFRYAGEPRYGLELVFLKLIEQHRLVPLEELIASLKKGNEKKN